MQMPEIPVILTGTVFRYQPATDFKTKLPAGAKIAVIGDAGATELKFSQEQVEAGLAPTVGDIIALVVEPFPWKMDNGNAGVSFLFREHLTEAHILQLQENLS